MRAGDVDAAEAGELSHLGEEVEGENAHGEGDHQEVDPVAAARDRADEEAGADRGEDAAAVAGHGLHAIGEPPSAAARLAIVKPAIPQSATWPSETIPT